MATRECVNFVTTSYFGSRSKDGGRAIRSYAPRTLHRSMCYKRGVIGDGIFTLLCWHAGFRCENTGWLSTFFAPVTLTLTPWPSYTTLTCTPWRYTGCANVNFLRQGFRKLSSDRQTDRQADRIDRNYKPRPFAGDQQWYHFIAFWFYDGFT